MVEMKAYKRFQATIFTFSHSLGRVQTLVSQRATETPLSATVGQHETFERRKLTSASRCSSLLLDFQKVDHQLEKLTAYLTTDHLGGTTVFEGCPPRRWEEYIPRGVR